jgi:hypothetical protein
MLHALHYITQKTRCYNLSLHACHYELLHACYIMLHAFTGDHARIQVFIVRTQGFGNSWVRSLDNLMIMHVMLVFSRDRL